MSDGNSESGGVPKSAIKDNPFPEVVTNENSSGITQADLDRVEGLLGALSNKAQATRNKAGALASELEQGQNPVAAADSSDNNQNNN